MQISEWLPFLRKECGTRRNYTADGFSNSCGCRLRGWIWEKGWRWYEKLNVVSRQNSDRSLKFEWLACPACVPEEQKYQSLREQKLALLQTPAGCVEWLDSYSPGEAANDRQVPAAIEAVIGIAHTDQVRIVGLLLRLYPHSLHNQKIAEGLKRLVPRCPILNHVLREAREHAKVRMDSYPAVYGEDDFRAVQAQAREERRWGDTMELIDELL